MKDKDAALLAGKHAEADRHQQQYNKSHLQYFNAWDRYLASQSKADALRKATDEAILKAHAALVSADAAM